MFRLMIRVVVVMALAGLTGAAVQAQDDPTAYIVTSQQSINARSCPRLTCAIVRTFAPGEQFAVIETAQGETVSGSNVWLHVTADDEDLYVHSSLAAPQPGDDRDPAVDRAAVDTRDWVAHSGDGYEIKVPPGWIDFGRLLDNEEYLSVIAEALGLDPEEFVQQYRDLCGGNACAFAYCNIDSGANVILIHGPSEGPRWSAKLWKAMLEEELESNGTEIIESEVVNLPAGEGVRIHARQRIGPGRFEMDTIAYFIETDAELYILEFSQEPDLIEDEIPVFEAIAASFRINEKPRQDQQQAARH